MNTTIDLQSFFPVKYFEILSTNERKDSIKIKLKSITKSCLCHVCGEKQQSIMELILEKFKIYL